MAVTEPWHTYRHFALMPLSQEDITVDTDDQLSPIVGTNLMHPEFSILPGITLVARLSPSAADDGRSSRVWFET